MQISGLSGVVAVAPAWSESPSSHLALRSDGTVLAFGYDYTVAAWQLRPIADLADIVAIDQNFDDNGGYHRWALRRDGTLFGWGSNRSGELGDGTTTDRTSPAPVGGLPPLRSFSAGGRHVLALDANGSVWAWGQNIFGQLGDGTTTNRLSPEKIDAVASAVGIEAGRLHSTALRNDGTLLSWGYNTHGELGDGTGFCQAPCSIQFKSTPVSVSTVRGVTNVSSQSDKTLVVAEAPEQAPNPPPGDLAPQFTQAPGSNTIYPPLKGSRSIRLTASDPNGQQVTINWETLPDGLVCSNEQNPGAPAIVGCELRRTPAGAGIAVTRFVATDSDGLTATTTVRIGELRYVAMGDSYHSGEGTLPFDPGTDGIFNWCHRSLDAAAVRFARDLGSGLPPIKLSHVACSGAVIKNLYESASGEPPQLEALGPDVGLVTLSIGGNDAEFAPVLKSCMATRSCRIWKRSETERRLAWLDTPNSNYGGYTPLEGTYRRIRELAPNAQVLVVGYPRLFQIGGSLIPCWGITKFDQQWVNSRPHRGK